MNKVDELSRVLVELVQVTILYLSSSHVRVFIKIKSCGEWFALDGMKLITTQRQIHCSLQLNLEN